MHLLRLQPIREGEQISRHRATGAHLPLHGAIGLADEHTDDHRALMNIYSSTALMDHLHLLFPFLAMRAGAGCAITHEFLSRAHHPLGRGNSHRFLDAPWSAFFRGLAAPSTARPGSACPPAEPATFSSASLTPRVMGLSPKTVGYAPCFLGRCRMRHSLGVIVAFARLQARQAVTRLSRVLLPPRLTGMT